MLLVSRWRASWSTARAAARARHDGARRAAGARAGRDGDGPAGPRVGARLHRRSSSLCCSSAGTSWRHFAGLVALSAVAVALALVGAAGRRHTCCTAYQVDRLTSFLHPTDEPGEAGYQQNQSKIAIGAGQKTGRGVSATQTKLDFLPEHHTDFIFAVVGERWGFVGAALVLSLYALFIWSALRILTMSKNLYGALIAGGIVAMLMFQVFVNVGMNIGIMPITGIPLPLMSYGGSSVLTTLLAVGLLQSIYAQGRAAASHKGRVPPLPEGPNTYEEASACQRRSRGDPRGAAGSARTAGRPKARRRAPKKAPPRLPRRRALPRAPRQPLDRRQHLQGQGRQRPARAGGRVRRHRPRQERLPPRRRDRAAGRRDAAARPRQGGRQEDHRPAQARPGDRRPGRQGPAEDEGRPPVDGADHRRALHGLRADGRGRRRVQAPRRQGARPPAREAKGSTSPAAARSSAPRRTGATREDFERELQYLFKLNEVLAQAGGGHGRPGDGVPGGRPLRPRRARHLLRRLRARARRRREAAPPPRLVLHPHRARARRPRRALRGRQDAAVRGLRRREGHRRAAHARASTCPAAATS